MESLPLERALVEGYAEVWRAAGLVAVSWHEPFADGTRWPVTIGPKLPLDLDEVVVMSPRPHAPIGIGHNVSQSIGVRIRSAPVAADRSDEDAVRNAVWAQGLAMCAALTPGGRPGGPYRFEGVNVAQVQARPTLFYDLDGGDRFGLSLDLLTLARPIRRT